MPVWNSLLFLIKLLLEWLQMPLTFAVIGEFDCNDGHIWYCCICGWGHHQRGGGDAHGFIQPIPVSPQQTATVRHLYKHRVPPKHRRHRWVWMPSHTLYPTLSIAKYHNCANCWTLHHRYVNLSQFQPCWWNFHSFWSFWFSNLTVVGLGMHIMFTRFR